MEATSNGVPQPIEAVMGQAITRLSESAATSDSRRLAAASVSDDEREQNAKDMRRQSVWDELKKAAGPRYEKCRLENYEVQHDGQQQAVDQLKAYADEIDERFDSGQNVLFLGPAGTGKDHLLFGLMYRHVAKYRAVLWVNGVDLWLSLRAAIGGENKGARRKIPQLYPYNNFDADLDGNESEIVDKLSRVDILAISDPLPPGGSLTDYQAATLFSIVDVRYRHMRPTMLTINVATRAEMSTRMGEPIVDRLAHSALIVPCNWPSFRKGTSKGVDHAPQNS